MRSTYNIKTKTESRNYLNVSIFHLYQVVKKTHLFWDVCHFVSTYKIFMKIGTAFIKLTILNSSRSTASGGQYEISVPLGLLETVSMLDMAQVLSCLHLTPPVSGSCWPEPEQKHRNNRVLWFQALVVKSKRSLTNVVCCPFWERILSKPTKKHRHLGVTASAPGTP